MKTTLDLPEALVRELQRRARQHGQDVAHLAADLLWKGLAASPSPHETTPPATIETHPLTGLPYIACSHPAPPEAEMTPDRVADLLVEQEAAGGWRQRDSDAPPNVAVDSGANIIRRFRWGVA